MKNYFCKQLFYMEISYLVLAFFVSVVMSGCFLSCGFLNGAEATYNNTIEAKLETKTAWVEQDGDSIAIDFVRPLINGKDIGWFALDTGSPIIAIDSKYTESFDMPVIRTAQIPECNMPISFLRGTILELGRLTLSDPVFVAIDLASLNARANFEEPMAGIIGYPVFAEAIIKIEYSQKRDRISLYDPKNYQLKTGQWQPLKIDGRDPIITAKLEGDISGEFLLDTGKGGNLSLYTEFLEEHNFLKNRPVVKKRNSRLCGDTPELAGQIDWFELSGERFANPVVRFKIPGTLGSEGDGGIIGTIGRGFLQRFTVVFNYPDEKIAFISK